MSLQKNLPERLVRQFQKHNKVLFQYQVPLRPEVLLKNSIKWSVNIFQLWIHDGAIL